MYNPNRGPFAGMDQAALRANLAIAQEAYAKLMTGAKMVETKYTTSGSETSATYTAANKIDLYAYIQSLQAALGIVKNPRRAGRIVFR
ncbi:MAG: gpW family head-tail joining protein [Methylococcales bacterium]